MMMPSRQSRSTQSKQIELSWPALLAGHVSFVALTLALTACPGNVGGEDPVHDPPSPAESGAQPDQTTPDPPPPDPQPDAGSTLPPDSGAASSCPPGAPSDDLVAGEYAGTYKGKIKAVLPLNITGTLSFTVAPGASGLVLQNGKVVGSVLGMAFELPMTGTVTCGKLDGTGSGLISGIEFSGKYLAAWADGSFSGGTWSGKDKDALGEGSGDWSAKKK